MATEPAPTPTAAAPPVPPPSGGHAAPSGPMMSSANVKLAMAALGVVFGDIGTSPLYALKECFTGEHAVPPSPENVFGVLSLVFWSLLLVIVVKYLTFIMRADNQGEGGILALLALVRDKSGKSVAPPAIVLLVLFGAALLYGDGMITPAISVLSAMEGLEVATTALKPAVVPLTCAVLLGLFLIQSRGTERVGSVFGPVTLLWFFTIGAFGLVQVVGHPEILAALNPIYAVDFFRHNGSHGFLVLGAVVLVITGGEALYADMGHFGRSPIRLGWFTVVMPALLLNYFGQGAYLVTQTGEVTNPFYAIVPTWALYPTVAIATAATVVASQALISGAYSLTQQAVQLGYFPRVTIVHTSKHTEGQIYIPEINNLLLVACIGLVLAFKESSALAAAYGIAVTGTMGITTVVYFVVATRTWNWPIWKALPPVLLFLIVDVSFFGANALKFFHGGWFPVVIAIFIFTVMTTWAKGRRHLGEVVRAALLPIDIFLKDVAERKPHRVRGTAVFMSSSSNGISPVLLHHFKHNQVLHEQVVLLSVVLEHVPEVPADRRVELEVLGEGFFRVTARYGFMQQPNVPWVLRYCATLGLKTELSRTSYYLGRETLLPTGKAKMARWRKSLFSFVSRNARTATDYFGLPPNRVVELGMQIDF